MKSRIFLWLGIFLASTVGYAASTPWQSNPQGKVRLIAPYAAAPEEGTIYLGVQFKPAPGWMVYWKNSGDVGFPPTFDFKGSRGFKDPEVLWPRPKMFVLPGNIREYGYNHDVVYPVKARAAPTGSTLQVAVEVNYLTCEASCVPYRYSFTLDVPRAAVPQPDPAMESLLQRFLNQVPTESDAAVLASLRPEEIEPPWHGWILLLGFLGGLILNVMPCVLPVLSIKLFGLLEHGGHRRRVIVRDALASAAGIVASFLVGGGVAVLGKEAGMAVGWGIQFQNPLFVAGLAVIVALFALNLWGLFEISLPPALAHVGALAGQQEGIAPYFVSGMLATLLATPCSAPFLGTAMGFALSQRAGVVMAMFFAAGMGMALPYFILAAFPWTLYWLPKPGVWMVHVRGVLGFFLAATVVWLGYVLSSQVSAVGMAFIYLGLLAVGAIAWLKQGLMTSRYRDMRSAKLGVWILLAAVFSGILAVVDAHREIKSGVPMKPGRSSSPWRPFDAAQIPALVKSGKSVFVDVTADWCFTCKYNEKFVLDSADVAQAFQEQGIVLMKADWTNRDAAIGEYLKSFNRYGIPFYALYRPGQQPNVLPELLTKGTVLRALKN